jgi:hypothetical protein
MRKIMVKAKWEPMPVVADVEDVEDVEDVADC